MLVHGSPRFAFACPKWLSSKCACTIALMNFFFVCLINPSRPSPLDSFVSNSSTMDAMVSKSKFKSFLEKISARDFAMASSRGSFFSVIIEDAFDALNALVCDVFIERIESVLWGNLLH